MFWIVKAFSEFSKMYYSDPSKFKDIKPDYSFQKKILEMNDINMNAFNALQVEIDKFPQILYKLSTEIKEKMIFKGIKN